MKLLRSVIGLVAGWSLAIAAILIWQIFGPGPGYVRDLSFFLTVPAGFAFVGWLLFVVPIILWVRADHPLLQFPVIIAAGAAYAVIVYGLMVCTWLSDGWTLAWFPAIMGGVGGGLYSLLGRMKLFREHPPIE